MFNQSGEQRPGWYVLAVRLAKITSSAFSSVNRLRSVPRLGPLAADPNARNRSDFLPQSLSQICRVVTLAFDRGKRISNRFRGCS